MRFTKKSEPMIVEVSTQDVKDAAAAQSQYTPFDFVCLRLGISYRLIGGIIRFYKLPQEQVEDVRIESKFTESAVLGDYKPDDLEEKIIRPHLQGQKIHAVDVLFEPLEKEV